MKVFQTSTRPILLTAFEPFDNSGINASEQVLGSLLAEPVLQSWPTDALATAVLPVVYEADVAVVESAITKHRPRLIVHLGQSSTSPRVAVERVALNLKQVDDGRLVPILAGAPLAYQTTLPVTELVAAMRAGVQNGGDLSVGTGPGEPTPVTESAHAGTFLCNHTLYRSLHRAAVSDGPPAVFVHVPRLPEQAEVLRRTGADTKMATLPREVSVRALVAGLIFLRSWA